MSRPRTQADGLLGSLRQYGMRSLHEEFSHEFVSAPAGTGELLLASGGVLAGTTPSQAANPRPFLKAAPLPMAVIVAVPVIGPIPGIATTRLHDSSSPQMRTISSSDSSICPCRYCISNCSCLRSTRNAPDNLLSGSSRIPGRDSSI